MVMTAEQYEQAVNALAKLITSKQQPRSAPGHEGPVIPVQSDQSQPRVCPSQRSVWL